MEHETLDLVDKVAVVGELEHIRSHALRSASSLGDENGNVYLIIAAGAKRVRREYMKRNFPDLGETDWCLVKAAAHLRQLTYETESSMDELVELEDLTDAILSQAFKRDMSGCMACREDQEAVDKDKKSR